jgi:hypothetical protein
LTSEEDCLGRVVDEYVGGRIEALLEDFEPCLSDQVAGGVKVSMGEVNPLTGKTVSSVERSGLTPGFVVLEVLTGGEDKTDHNSRTLRSQASFESGWGVVLGLFLI